MVFVNVPGVRIEETALAPPPIFGVSTSVAGFVGFAPGAVDAADTGPRLVTSADQFIKLYMGGANRSNSLSRAALGFFANGGTQCYIVHTPTANAADLVAGVKLLEKVGQISMIAAPGGTDAIVRNELTDQAEDLKDRIALLEPAAALADIGQLLPGGAARPGDSEFAAFYYPRIKVGKAVIDGKPLDADPDSEAVTPVGHIAGVYARVDATKGVHKAPANETLRNVLDVEQVVSDAEQNALNPKGINVLRVFSGNVTIWGARTLQDADNPQDRFFIYVSTRRLVSYIAESLQAGLRYVVFEPNTLSIRQQITRSVRGFLDGVWRDGGLFGETPKQSYYVTFPPLLNTDNERAAGKLTLEVGLRVSFPAEFVVVRIGVILQDPSAG